MRVKFPQTLEAAQAAEKSQWKIGDALVREAIADRTGDRGLNAVAAELDEHDLDFSPSYLSQLRSTAEAFPRSRRLDLPWKVHVEAGNPDTLDVIVKAARRDSKKVTIWYVGDVLRQMRAEQQRAYEKEIAAAKREAEKAAEAERKAREEEQLAANERERERAKAKRLEAADRKRKASEKVKATKSPKRKDAKPPAEEDVSVLHASALTKANAGKARKLAEESRKVLKANIGDLSEGIIAGLTDAAMEAANAWIEVANLLRSATSNKRGHLSVVNQ